MRFETSCPLGPNPFITCGAFLHNTYYLCRSGYGYMTSSSRRNDATRLTIAGCSIAAFLLTLGKKQSHLTLTLGSMGLIFTNLQELKTKSKETSAAKLALQLCMGITALEAVGFFNLSFQSKERYLTAAATTFAIASWILPK